MKTLKLTALLVFSSLLGYGNTAFYVNTSKSLLAKNHDSKSGHGVIIQNLPGQLKTAYGFHQGEKANWISLYGSLTVNQLGKEFPIGGINEAGLVVEHLYLGASEYPDSPGPSLSELEWIQYQLDNYGSVQEVLLNINSLRIRPLETIHYIIADPCGNAAIIDFIEGTAKIYPQQGNYQVMTQSSAESNLSFYEENKERIGKSGNSSLDRYMLLMGYLGQNPDPDVSLSFDFLNISANKTGAQKTQWGIVYDLQDRCIHLKTSALPMDKKICLREFDFESDSIYLASPIQTKALHWQPMNENSHANLLALWLKHEHLKLDERAFVSHAGDPSFAAVDSVYIKNHVDLVVKFVTNKPSGLVSYVFKEETQPYQTSNGIKSGQFVVDKKETTRVIYNMPKAQVGLACFQDPEFKGSVETKIDNGTNGFSYLRTQGYHSGNVPRYVDTKIDLRQQTDITVRIK